MKNKFPESFVVINIIHMKYINRKMDGLVGEYDATVFTEKTLKKEFPNIHRVLSEGHGNICVNEVLGIVDARERMFWACQ